MEHIAYSRETFYCHGLLGSAAEITHFRPKESHGPHMLPPLDLSGFDRALHNSECGTAHIIGFSLGAMTALRIAALRPDQVSEITLIAPAAPLELGDFLPQMAGRAVFNMATKGRTPFAIFTAVQRLGVALAPKRVIKSMFAGSPQPDLDLLSEAVFEAALLRGLKSSLGPERASYIKAVLSYVEPWAHLLTDIKCPVKIYHGTDDPWAPIDMAYALKNEISSDVTVNPLKGLGHYSALQKVLPTLLRK